MIEEEVVSKPTLDAQISVGDFRMFYWPKGELVMFCQKYGIPTVGSKAALVERIVVYLATSEMRRAKIKQQARTMMAASGGKPDQEFEAL